MATVVTQFPRAVREVENLFIPLRDGTRLAARIFLPEDAEDHPVPAILEYLPYRKRDGTGERDALTHPYFAGHGYAAVRVDMRGCGESDGLLHDEYLLQEQDDCLEVIAWLARQPWCSGAVGMFGISWGGFNGLQVAARRPPALKAVVSVCSTDDRYADDVHFMGGALLTAKFSWAATMFGGMTRPPDPALVGEPRWREMWLDRLHNLPLLAARWLGHQRRDAYYKHGSICEDFAAVACPVYAVGGWGDGYSNAVPRLLAGLAGPRKGLIGPWAHKYPHLALPGPRIGFLQECLRWWDKWLKGIETGIMDEPMLRVWMMESARPAAFNPERPGRWVAEEGWPPPSPPTGDRPPPQRLHLTTAGLQAGVPEGNPEALLVASPEGTGTAAGTWFPYGVPGDDPADQRGDDAGSVTVDTLPLDARLEILGAPVIELELSADRPQAVVAVRLCDVFPDGASTRVTYGLLNLSHRDSHEHPSPLEPGQRCRVRIQLNDVAYAFPPGNRIRIAVSSAYWPIAWPAPERATLRILTGGSSLLLPVRLPRPADDRLVPFPPAETAQPERRTLLRAGSSERTVTRDLISGETVLRMADDSGLVRIEATGLEVGSVKWGEYRIVDGDPLSARVATRWTHRVGRGAWQTRTETSTVVTAGSDRFHVIARMDAYEGEEHVAGRDWEETVPRDMV